MKRILALLIAISCITSLWGFSVLDRTIEQPFDSVKELLSFDFSKSLAPHQKAWAEDTKIHLLTVGSGDDLYAWFGHSALIFTSPSGSKVMYDWGIFDPNQEYFYLNFARGRMYYYVVASEATWRIEDAIAEKRDVSLVELNFTPEAKFALISFLQTHVQGSYSTYLYHFYDDNCATRIRDIIDRATDGAFKLWAESETLQPTLRNQVMRFMIHNPALFWILDFLQGPLIDKRLTVYDQLFLPSKLEQAVLDFTFSDGTPLAVSREVLFDTKEMAIRFSVDESSKTHIWGFALFGVALALFLTLLGHRRITLKRLILGLIMFMLGLLGCLLLFMMSFSDMDMTFFNENILFCNPLLLYVAYRMLFKKQTQSTLLGLFSLVMILLILIKLLFPALLIQDNWRVILLLFPLYLSGARGKRRGHGKKGQAF